MTEPNSGFVYQADVALFRAVHTIPFARLKDIICTHYGAKHFDAEWRRVRGARQGLASGNNNLYLYVSITNRLGRKDEAVGEIMRVYRDITRMESVSKGRVETLASQQTVQPPVEPADPSVFDNAMIEAVESFMEVDEDMSEYLEAFKCNTTRSCCLEVGDMKCYSSEYDSDDDYEYEEGDWCSDQDESAPDQGDAPQGDEGGYQGILEDETDEKPKVVIDEK